MRDGWIKVYGKMLQWEWYGDPNMVATWLHLLLTANWRDKKWRGMDIKRGQLVTSVAKLSEAIGQNEWQTRSCLDRLEKSKQILKQSTNKNTIITICNYDIYQDKDTTDTQANHEQGHKQNTNEPQTSHEQPTSKTATTEDYKEVEEREEREEGKKNNTHTLRAGARLGIFENVNINETDLDKIRMNFAMEGLGDDFILRCIDKLSTFMANGRHYDNHAAAILHWVKAAVLEEDRRTGKTKPATTTSQKSRDEEIIEQSLRQAWEKASEEERQDYLNKYGCYPWEN